MQDSVFTKCQGKTVRERGWEEKREREGENRDEHKLRAE